MPQCKVYRTDKVKIGSKPTKPKSVEANNNNYTCNESTAGTDASMEVSKLHNIKLLAILHTLLMINIVALINFAAQETRIVGNDRHDCECL